MLNLNNQYLYVKGTCNVNVSDIATGEVVFASSKVMNNALTTSVDMGEIRAGLGNPIAIQLPSNAAVNLELSTADFNLQARAMQVGGMLAYNGIRPMCAAVTASGATISLPDGATPVANYGFDKVYAYVTYAGADNIGTAYEVDTANGNLVSGFVAVNGNTYNVTWFERQANAQELGISGSFAPGIYHVSSQLAVYTTEGGNAGNRGSQCGWLYIYIPRMQFAANAETNGNQTDPANTILSGTALGYEETSEACTDCTFPMLAYMVYVPFVTSGNGLVGIAVVGGGVSVKVGEDVVLPVKYVMADNTLVQPNYGHLTFSGNTAGTATVTNGVVHGVAAGTTPVTITTSDDAGLSCKATITVTSA